MFDFREIFAESLCREWTVLGKLWRGQGLEALASVAIHPRWAQAIPLWVRVSSYLKRARGKHTHASVERIVCCILYYTLLHATLALANTPKLEVQNLPYMKKRICVYNTGSVFGVLTLQESQVVLLFAPIWMRAELAREGNIVCRIPTYTTMIMVTDVLTTPVPFSMADSSREPGGLTVWSLLSSEEVALVEPHVVNSRQSLHG